MAEVFATQKVALEYLDPLDERVWEELQTDDASIVAVSTRYRERSIRELGQIISPFLPILNRFEPRHQLPSIWPYCRSTDTAPSRRLPSRVPFHRRFAEDRHSQQSLTRCRIRCRLCPRRLEARNAAPLFTVILHASKVAILRLGDDAFIAVSKANSANRALSSKGFSRRSPSRDANRAQKDLGSVL